MNFDLEIVSYLRGSKATVYSIKFNDCKNNEAVKFFLKFYKTHKNDIKAIVAKLNYIKDRDGCQEYHFKPISKRDDNVEQIKQGNLRLFVLKYSKFAFIIGGGDEKPKNIGAYQEVETLNKLADILRDLSIEIDKRIKDNEIYFDNNNICGNLKF